MADSTSSRVIRKGERVVVTHGCYSAYKTMTVAEASEDIDIDAIRQEFNAWAAGKNLVTDEYYAEYRFLAWLIVVRKLLTEVPMNLREWHLGDYTLGDTDYEVGPWRDGSWDEDFEAKYAKEEIEALIKD